MELKFFKCKVCGNIIEKIADSGVPVSCCGQPMEELKAGTSDGAVEKHVPVWKQDGNDVNVVVGEVDHPMVEEHFIEWIVVQTDKGVYRKNLSAGEAPAADFKVCDGEKVEVVYAYCNLHGLWKA
ncbi:desulfoferrodoxin family protein [Eubacterium xylanophilum]|uniref:desulfoferrodoxin family protein n=1 Tax=Eubacterium xylanophilum TaxID=39497 RepID=UPI00047BB7A5|nr:desulfoferrodoxin family protein [Eubacterium xylanophilum]